MTSCSCSKSNMAVSNGIGRYVCQLKRLTFNYCPTGGSSRGMREFIDQSIVKFAENHPNIAIYVTKRHGRHPRIVANYLNGNSKVIPIKNTEPVNIQTWVERLKGESGIKTEGIAERWQTKNPTTQGTWTPFLNQPSCRLDLEEIAKGKYGAL